MPSTRPRALTRALHHPVRATLKQRIYAAADPIPLAELAQAFDVAIVAIRYHVRVLVACGLAGLDRDDCAYGR